MSKSIKLEEALASKKVFIKKLVSGEVTIHFKDPKVKDVVVSHSGTMDLLAKRSVTVDAIRNSNLQELIANSVIQII